LEASEKLEKDLCENINKEKGIIHASQNLSWSNLTLKKWS